MLSFPPIKGTWGYAIEIREPVGEEDEYLRHQLTSTSKHITLPEWFQKELSGKTRDVSVMAADANRTPYLTDYYWGFPPDIKMGFTFFKESGDGYVEEDVLF